MIITDWKVDNIFEANGEWVACKDDTKARVWLNESGWNINWYDKTAILAPTSKWTGISVWAACGILLELKARLEK